MTAATYLQLQLTVYDERDGVGCFMLVLIIIYVLYT